MLLVPLTISVLRSLLHRDVGVDAIALVSMAGSLVLGEYLAGGMVGLVPGLRQVRVLHVPCSTRTRLRRRSSKSSAPCTDAPTCAASSWWATTPTTHRGLLLADVGIAIRTMGATVPSQTADAVILVDRVDRVADAIRIGRRSLFIARQSVLAGTGISLIAFKK